MDTKHSDVIIIGAGPAGLFAAYELALDRQITILESKNYVGGSGLHSDGKLNFSPEIGGDLPAITGNRLEAADILIRVQSIFEADLGIVMPQFNAGRLMTVAARAGVKFIPALQAHIGSDHLPSLIGDIKSILETRGVDIILNTTVNSIECNNGIVVKTDAGHYSGDHVILAPGRIGNQWLIDEMKALDVPMQYNPIDIGVRIEVDSFVTMEITDVQWDPKFHIRTPSYDDSVRTFCTCPHGYVTQESYGNGMIGVNGHSMRDTHSSNTNFALLTSVGLTQPLENTTEYGKRLVQTANTLGGGKPLVQRLGDLENCRRSTWSRIRKGRIQPTLQDVTPGDIAMAYPSRIVSNILEAMDKLDHIMPGLYTDSTLIYAPEVKFYAMKIETDSNLMTKIPGLYVAGDGSGKSRGIVGAAATGIIAARGILNE